jgi:hypothetical protein
VKWQFLSVLFELETPKSLSTTLLLLLASTSPSELLGSPDGSATWAAPLDFA